MFKKYFRVSKQDLQPRTSYINDSCEKTISTSSIERNGSMLQRHVLTKEKVTIQEQWEDKILNPYREPIISRRTSSRRFKKGTVNTFCLPLDERSVTDAECELSPRSDCSRGNSELIKLNAWVSGEFLNDTQSSEIVRTSKLLNTTTNVDRSDHRKSMRNQYIPNNLYSKRRSSAEIRRRSFRCENLLPRKQLNLSKDFTDVEMDALEFERLNSKDFDEMTGCPSDCVTADEKPSLPSTAQNSRSMSKEIRMQTTQFRNSERKLSSTKFGQACRLQVSIPCTENLSNFVIVDKETKTGSITEVDGEIMNKLFDALSKITELQEDLGQVKDSDDVKMRFQERTSELEKSIQELEREFNEKKDLWENQIEEYKEQNENYETQIAQLRKKHEDDRSEHKRNVHKMKRDHLQSMADLRESLTGWSENIDDALEEQKKENRNLKKKLQARKIRQEELEEEIVKLENECTHEANEALRLTRELVEAREEIKLLKTVPLRRKNSHSCKSIEKECRELRSSHADLLGTLNKKEQREKENMWEVQRQVLECERLQGVVLQLRRERSGRVSYTAIDLKQQEARRENIKIPRGHCRAKTQTIPISSQLSKLLRPSVRVLRTSVGEDEFTENSIMTTDKIALPGRSLHLDKKARSSGRLHPRNRSLWSKSFTKSRKANSVNEQSCNVGGLRPLAFNGRSLSINQLENRSPKQPSLFDSDSESTYTCHRKTSSFTISKLLKDASLSPLMQIPSQVKSDSENESDGNFSEVNGLEFKISRKKTPSDKCYQLVDKSELKEGSELRDVTFPARLI